MTSLLDKGERKAEAKIGVSVAHSHSKILSWECYAPRMRIPNQWTGNVILPFLNTNTSYSCTSKPQLHCVGRVISSAFHNAKWTLDSFQTIAYLQPQFSPHYLWALRCFFEDWQRSLSASSLKPLENVEVPQLQKIIPVILSRRTNDLVTIGETLM